MTDRDDPSRLSVRGMSAIESRLPHFYECLFCLHKATGLFDHGLPLSVCFDGMPNPAMILRFNKRVFDKCQEDVTK